MNNLKFKFDYFNATGEELTKVKLFFKVIKNLSIRYIYIGRLQEKSKNLISRVILNILIQKYKEKYGLHINFKNIGEGLQLIYPYSIVINPNAFLGKNNVIFKGVLIGSIRSGNRKGIPKIGDNVVICANSIIVGGIKIGNDVMIAPNSFVNFDVPSNSLVIGNPGIIYYKENPAKDYVKK